MEQKAGPKRSGAALKLGLVGVGKIARDQHLPSLEASADFTLIATASRNASVDGAEAFRTIEEMLDKRPDIDAVSICTPPQAHFEAVRLALQRGKHVLLEKPPCTTTRQLDELAALAHESGRTLFQTWHSRCAAGVPAAKEWLARRKIVSAHISWKEDVRHWHPGQAWIWQAGGFGVFDPGINAISILTEILAPEVFVERAALTVPENCQAPIAADIDFVTDDGAPIRAEFDFRQTGPQTWDIAVETEDGALTLSFGGSELSINGRRVDTPGPGEYPALYARFAELIAAGQSDVDARPFQLVADAFLVGSRLATEAFIE